MTDLRDKTAIVTGGGSGIGEATAKALAAQGVNVVICGRREASLARVAGDIRSAGGIVHPVAADVSQEAEVERVVSTALAELLGRERPALKTDVRKLKRLGLTESLEVGYELSPRGRAFLDATR